MLLILFFPPPVQKNCGVRKNRSFTKNKKKKRMRTRLGLSASFQWDATQALSSLAPARFFFFLLNALFFNIKMLYVQVRTRKDIKDHTFYFFFNFLMFWFFLVFGFFSLCKKKEITPALDSYC